MGCVMLPQVINEDVLRNGRNMARSLTGSAATSTTTTTTTSSGGHCDFGGKDNAIVVAFTRELEVLAKLRHPNVLKIKGACVSPPRSAHQHPSPPIME